MHTEFLWNCVSILFVHTSQLSEFNSLNNVVVGNNQRWHKKISEIYKTFLGWERWGRGNYSNIWNEDNPFQECIILDTVQSNTPSPFIYNFLKKQWLKKCERKDMLTIGDINYQNMHSRSVAKARTTQRWPNPSLVLFARTTVLALYALLQDMLHIKYVFYVSFIVPAPMTSICWSPTVCFGHFFFEDIHKYVFEIHLIIGFYVLTTHILNTPYEQVSTLNCADNHNRWYFTNSSLRKAKRQTEV